MQWAAEINGKSPQAQRMLKFAFNLLDDGLVGQQLFAGEATRLAYMTDEAVEGRDAFLEKRAAGLEPVPALLLGGSQRAPRLPTCEQKSASPVDRRIALTGMRRPRAAGAVNRPATKRRLRGKRVLITGASSGIGEAGAEEFAAEGAEVVVVARRQDLLDALAERITAAGGTATRSRATCPTWTPSTHWSPTSTSASAASTS